MTHLLQTMASSAQLRAHKGALQKLSELTEDKKEEMTSEEYRTICNLHKTLYDAANGLAARGLPSGAVPVRGSDDDEDVEQPIPDQSMSESEEESDLHLRTESEQLVYEVQCGDREIQSLVTLLRSPLATESYKAHVLDAIRDLVSDGASTVAVEATRQTALGAAGVIDSVAPFVINPDHLFSEWPLQYKGIVALSAVARRHHANRTRVGEAGVIPAVTHIMRHGSDAMEALAVKLLAEIGFQHTPNQSLMASAGTAEAIVHLMGQIRTPDRIERSVKLLWNVVCEGATPSPLIEHAVRAGVIPILLRLLTSGMARPNTMETMYKLVDNNDAHQQVFANEGGIPVLVSVLQEADSPLEEQAKAARLLGEVGGQCFQRRKAIADLGVIPILKELVEEPTGRRRQAFAFALSRLDEDGDGIAAKDAERRRKRKAQEAAAEEARLEREKRQAEGRREREALQKRVADSKEAFEKLTRANQTTPPTSSRGSSSRTKPTAPPTTSKPTKTIAKPSKRARK